jgi:hypothetical protein
MSLMETVKLLSLRSLPFALPLLEIGAIVLIVATLPFSGGSDNNPRNAPSSTQKRR